MDIKKKLMELMWRMQQSQTIIGVLMWSLTLAGIFYPYIRDKFGLSSSEVLVPMMALFLFILFCVVLIGIIFDKLRFWKEQNIVINERNPYATTKFTPKEIHLYGLMVKIAQHLPDKSKELQQELDLMDSWLKKAVAEDPVVRQELVNIERHAGKQTPP